jgi:hypothetical protein
MDTYITSWYLRKVIWLKKPEANGNKALQKTF